MSTFVSSQPNEIIYLATATLIIPDDVGFVRIKAQGDGGPGLTFNQGGGGGLGILESAVLDTEWGVSFGISIIAEDPTVVTVTLNGTPYVLTGSNGQAARHFAGSDHSGNGGSYSGGTDGTDGSAGGAVTEEETTEGGFSGSYNRGDSLMSRYGLGAFSSGSPSGGAVSIEWFAA